ncbi:MAG: hypothetical protein E5X67_17690 [Mesorhizobium sp.]|nr:MAG: hypothetical protein E5X67_17690 [Mesorhizobium sp.]
MGAEQDRWTTRRCRRCPIRGSLNPAHSANGEALRSIILRAAQRSMAFRVGKATCYAIIKRLVDGWSLEGSRKGNRRRSSMVAVSGERPRNVARRPMSRR